MSGAAGVEEHEGEPVPGLPEALPQGEAILWQGAPSPRSFARHVFHARKVVVYFGLLVAWRAASAISEGEPLAQAAGSFGALLAMSLLGVGLLEALAWANRRATIYTLTNRRLVLRFGVALPMAVNLPFERIQSVGLKLHGDGTGDLTLRVLGAEKLGYLALWPHARPWRFGRDAEPMLRAIPDARAVAETLTRALGGPARRAAEREEPQTTPARAAAAAV